MFSAATLLNTGFKMTCSALVGANGGGDVLLLVALLFIKLQTFINNNPEGNTLK